MSLETWKQEFYSLPASNAPIEQALDHSIKKWAGLQPDNLAKHSVELVEVLELFFLDMYQILNTNTGVFNDT